MNEADLDAAVREEKVLRAAAWSFVRPGFDRLP
jgi:hypothetical protein